MKLIYCFLLYHRFISLTEIDNKFFSLEVSMRIAIFGSGKIGEVDMVLVGVKARQASEAAEAMRPMIGPETFVLPLQNGLKAPA